MSIYGSEFDPYKKYRERFGFKSNRQRVHVSNTPSTINENQDLEIRLPNLGASDVMIPGSLKLYFTLELSSSDTERCVVNNVCKSHHSKFENPV